MATTSPQDILDLAQDDQAQAIVRFNSLSEDHQLELIQSANAEDKKELLFLANNIRGIFPRLSGRDVIVALEAASASEFDVLIQYAHPDHLNFLLAMGCWRNGRIDETRFLHWIEVLNNCNDISLKDTLSDIDADFIAAAIRPFVTFPEQEVYDDFDEYNHGMIDAYSLTPEDCICDNDAVAEFLNRLHSLDKTLFSLLCIKLVYADPQEVFEHAFRMYTQRLKQEALPSWEEAAAIYNTDAAEESSAHANPDTQTNAETDIANRLDNGPFLSQVFAYIRFQENAEDSAAVIAREFGNLLTRIAVADGTAMDAFGRNRMVRKAEILCGLGLEQQSGSDVRIAAGLLSQMGLGLFFTLGHTLIARLHDQAKKVSAQFSPKEDESVHTNVPLRSAAILSNAEKEIPRRLLDNGNSRSIHNLRDYHAVLSDIAEIENRITPK